MDSIALLPEDVPGAVLRCDISTEEHSVTELQRWLECRGYKKTGKKHELILRVKNCIAAGNDSKIALGVDQGKWYDLKRSLVQSAGPSRSDDNVDPLSPVLLWAKFPSLVIPKYFNKGHIYTYIVDENVDDVDPTLEDINEDDTVTTVKPFRRGSQFVDSDHISEVFDAKKDNHYFVKCKCQSSFQKKVKYDVKIILNNISGAVIKGLCNCKQSALGKCVHVTAVLLFIWKYIEENGNAPIASTSKPREWGLGSSLRNPGPVSTAKYPIKRYNPLKRSKFNPYSHIHENDINMNSFLTTIQMGGKETMFGSNFKILYEEFEYSNEDLYIFREMTSAFLINMKKMIDAFPCIINEIPGTRQGSEEWLKWRSYFITSTNARIVCSIASESAKKNFLLKNLWQYTKKIETPAMRYGKINEDKAREKYKEFLNDDQEIIQVGLVVNENYPYFATSVDGLVLNTKGIDHIIEIKCPKLLEKSPVQDFDKVLTKKQLANFFLIKDNGEITIRKKHPYLYQICMSMLIFDVEMCNLSVWSPKSMLVIPVMRNEQLDIIEEIKDKASYFYKNIYVPEMFMMRTVRNLFPIELKNNHAL